MSFVIIKPRNHQKVLSSLANMLSFITSGRRSIEGISNIVSFDYHLLIIDSLVSIDGYDALNPRKTRIVRDAIFRLSKYKIKTVPYFKRAIDAEVQMIHKKRKCKFYVVFPTLINPISFPKTKCFSLAQSTIDVKNLDQIRQQFQIDIAMKQSSNQLSVKVHSFLMRRLNDITYLTLTRRASSPEQSFDSAQKVMDLFRGIVSFSLSRYTHYFQGGMPQPLAFVLPSPCFYVFAHDGAFRDYWPTWPLPFTLHIRTLNHQQVQVITALIKSFDQGLKRGNLVRRVLEPMLRLYGLALDQVDRGLTFLYLWQILELLALGHMERLSDLKKKKRIRSLLKDKLRKDVFEYLYKRRNLLVHEGRLDVRLEDELNALKSLCDYSISFLFENMNKLNDWRELKVYLQNIGLNKTEINLKIGVLREIIAD